MSSLGVNFLAGGCTGLLVDAVLFPLDVFKTRQQAETSRRRQAAAAAAVPRYARTAVSLSSAASPSPSSHPPPRSPPGSATAFVDAPVSVASSPSPCSPSSSRYSPPHSCRSPLAPDCGRPCSPPVLVTPGLASSASGSSLTLPAARDMPSPNSHAPHQSTPQCKQTGNQQKASSNGGAAPARNPSRGLSSSTCLPLSVALSAAAYANTRASSWTTVEAAKAEKMQVTLAPGNSLRIAKLGGSASTRRFPEKPRSGFLGVLARRYYPGLAVLAVGTFPSSALFFVTYEGTKQLLAKGKLLAACMSTFGGPVISAPVAVVCGAVASYIW